MNNKVPKFRFRFDRHVPVIMILVLAILVSTYFFRSKIASLSNSINSLTQDKNNNQRELEKIGAELQSLKNEDQIKINKDLREEVANIQNTYNKAVTAYEILVDFREENKSSKLLRELDKNFSEALKLLSDRKYQDADAKLSDITNKIKEEKAKITIASIPANIPQNNTPPGAGYSRQSVSAEGTGTFMVSLVAADLAGTKVIVDTASDSDCGDNCPVLPLATYASRTGAFAGVNGSYFCPATYPTCVGKTNSFDLLAMNHKKTYFNSSNNVYSTNPAVIFGDGYVRFVRNASEWGRDTSPTGVLSNYPLLVFNKSVVFGGDDDPKKGSAGGRSFVANKGNTVYIGVVSGATVAQSARVLHAMGMDNALNLDDGGSTAFWSGGYKIGPGRDLPNVILFVKK
jgi:hypothetical protein